MADRKYYCFCDSNCKFETMTKEQIITAIMQAVNEGTIGDIDSGFITTIKAINGVGIKFFYGTQAQFNQLTAEEKRNLHAIISDDTTIEGINEAIEELQKNYDELLDRLNNNAFNIKEAENGIVYIDFEFDTFFNAIQGIVNSCSGTLTNITSGTREQIESSALFIKGLLYAHEAANGKALCIRLSLDGSYSTIYVDCSLNKYVSRVRFRFSAFDYESINVSCEILSAGGFFYTGSCNVLTSYDDGEHFEYVYKEFSGTVSNAVG